MADLRGAEDIHYTNPPKCLVEAYIETVLDNPRKNKSSGIVRPSRRPFFLDLIVSHNIPCHNTAWAVKLLEKGNYLMAVTCVFADRCGQDAAVPHPGRSGESDLKFLDSIKRFRSVLAFLVP